MLSESTRLQDFPSLTALAYLNTAAESIPPRCTGEAIQEYWRDKGIRPRWEFEHQDEAITHVMVSWAAHDGPRGWP